jgi:hypothetical protein
VGFEVLTAVVMNSSFIYLSPFSAAFVFNISRSNKHPSQLHTAQKRMKTNTNHKIGLLVQNILIANYNYVATDIRVL